MRITNSMMRNNSLWNINKNEELLNKYNTQLSTGKKIQRPSENPIVAVRALKFRTTLHEVAQFKTNSEDAKSWLGVSEQALVNTNDLLKRARDICVQGSSDIFSAKDRATIINELEQIKTQVLNEGNVNYAGRFVFTGYKTDMPLVFGELSTDNYEITEHLGKNSIETIQKAIGNNIQDVHRIRLSYGTINEAAVPSTLAGFTITPVQSSDANAYTPVANTVHLIKDTGELIFNEGNVNGTATGVIPANFDFTYSKNNFVKGDLMPEHYFDCRNVTQGKTYTVPNDDMIYQISYNQELSINTLGRDVFTNDMVRDFDDMINAVKNIKYDGSLNEDLQKDLLGDFFSGMLTKLDKHINTVVREEAVIGSKVNRLDMTINRLSDDKINFTELLSLNEDVDMTEAVLNLQAQDIVYNASLRSSSRLMQQSLLDFLR